MAFRTPLHVFLVYVAVVLQPVLSLLTLQTPEGWSNLTQVDDISSLSASGPAKELFERSFRDYEWEDVVTHPEFEGYELKIRAVNHSPKELGVDTTNQYSGYLTVNGDSHMFFWFFESRSNPSTDPTLLWLNGGPGCSSLEGLLFENGPAIVQSDLSLKRNPWSWNNKANVIYLDQPVNAGYSYSQNSVSTTTAASKDVYAFLSLFFHSFPKYQKTEFHIAGESYGGHYIPVFASDILRAQNRIFNLTSVLIGNGLTDPLTQYAYYEPMACGDGGVDSVLSSFSCMLMRSSLPSCTGAIQRCYNNPQDTDACSWASQLCQMTQMQAFQRTGLNVYDMRRQCEQTASGLCYTQMEAVAGYLNQDKVKAAIGANPSIDYQSCNNKINGMFNAAGDWMQPYHLRVAELLNSNIPVLIYAGDKDFICNWLGNQAWTKALNYGEHNQFANQKPRQWTVNNKAAGEITNYERFSFLRVYNAGHMVPYDQPENAWHMLDSWLSKDYGYTKAT